MRPNSLRARLRWLNLAVVAAVLLPLGIASYLHTLAEVDELSDGRLAQSARTLDALLSTGATKTSADGEEAVIDVEGHHFETEVGFQVVDAGGHALMITSNLRHLAVPSERDQDFGNLRFDNHDWRVFTLRHGASPLVIRVAERYDSRKEITRGLMLEHALPLLLGLPILALLIGWAVRRGLRPLDELTDVLGNREPGSRLHIDLTNPARELQPVVQAINRQFDRLEDSLERERRFSADVAHELRTPLAAVLVHLENALASTHARDEPIRSAHDSAAGLARRIEQLLSLARLEAGASAGARSELDLVAIVTEVVEEMAMPIASGHVELSFSATHPQVPVRGHDAALRALVRNLLENALRHTGDGGQVDIQVTRSKYWTSIEVSDNGPGIPVERRAAVFARFHRENGGSNEGYGLGLSIVQRAAELHDAKIELLDSSFGQGLRVRVEIPAPLDFTA